MKKAAGVAPLLVSLMVLAGCGGGGSEAAEPGVTDTGATSSAEPSDTASPDVEPAAGHPIEAKELTMRTPKGYARAEATFGLGWAAFEPGGDLIGVGEARAYEALPDRAVARMVERGGTWGGLTPERGENVVVDGVSMVHLHGPNSLGRYDDSFSAVVGDHLVEIRFSQKGGAAVRDRVVASVLATVDWRG